MTAGTEQYLLPDEVCVVELRLQDTNGPKDVNSRASVVKEAASLESQSAAASPSGGIIKLEAVKSHVTCALCANLIASSLVLSCGHQYCGSCLFDWLGNKPCCPSCQVPLRAIPMRCIALDSIVEAFLTSLSDADLAAYKARQEEGKSAANKVNKMFWWLQPSAMPGAPGGGGPAGFGTAPAPVPPMPGMMGPKSGSFSGAPLPQQLPNGGIMTAGLMGAAAGFSSKASQSHTGMGGGRRSSNPGAPQVQQPGFPPRAGRANSFSAGGAPHNGMPTQPLLPPQVAASIAAAGFAAPPPMPPVGGGGAPDFESNYLSFAQKFGMEGVALPLVYQQLQQQQQQQQLQQQLLHACASADLSGVDLTGASSAASQASYADPAQLQQLLQGLYFA
ncbi:hypothetical protein HYH02_013747 [Chlamydomonas schloesseri]|uniref:RING-type domain-containing protein n=1 Tax=Chlamydomonas schloesseri TaxID=2026947 RepID=A0A835T1T9_9CHLO|nr:hypothetical protein HYH02_013747 [Chlamydomonas schloesseri]|eukprot:KAG2430385.1 hypothetical protein HYH02_013747 [Chlamydomonas schloesseri]